jgi:tetratricopeptide (TPR) repeat protein
METSPDISFERKNDELPHQYFELKDWDKLYVGLLDFEVFDYINKKNEYELGQYWRTLREKNKNTYSLSKFFDLESDEKTISRYYSDIGKFTEDVLADYTLALEFYKKALTIREKSLGVDHLDTALSYNNIGSVYSEIGKYEMALKFLQKALAIREKSLGLEHTDTAKSYDNIGNAYIGDSYIEGEGYERALELYKKALAIREKALGLEHPDTATSYNNLGKVYGEMNKHEIALEFYRISLVIREKLLGFDHPDTAMSYKNIGDVYEEMNKHEIALEFYQRAIVISEKLLGFDHPDTARLYCSIGKVYSNMTSSSNLGRKLEDYEEILYNKMALEFYQKALTIFEKSLSVDNPDTLSVYLNIAFVYDDLGKYIMKWKIILKVIALALLSYSKNFLTKIIRKRLAEK